MTTIFFYSPGWLVWLMLHFKHPFSKLFTSSLRKTKKPLSMFGFIAIAMFSNSPKALCMFYTANPSKGLQKKFKGKRHSYRITKIFLYLNFFLYSYVNIRDGSYSDFCIRVSMSFLLTLMEIVPLGILWV